MATKTSKKSEAKPSDSDLVRASAANPEASRAGTTNVHAVPASQDGRLDGCKIETLDGARANVSFVADNITQADLITLRKLLDQAIQETY